MTEDALRREFRDRFGSEPRVSRAPGRVNLIGEHTDYNDGLVLPIAIGMSTRVAFAPVQGRDLIVRSTAFPRPEVRLAVGGDRVSRGDWSDYVQGVLWSLEAASVRVPAAALWIDSDVPLGAGLSSSASLEVAVGGALLALAERSMSGEELALACQRAESEFVGTRCGIMDPFVSRLGRDGAALLLDCRSHEVTAVPMPPSVEVLLVHSGVRHDLAAGEYNRRRAECEAAIGVLSALDPRVGSLRDVDPPLLERARRRLGRVAYRRVRHVVGENARVLAFVEDLRAADFEAAGRRLFASHASLRDDYDVSCAELDALVEIAREQEAVLGARLTGGGFGGCTLNLVRAGHGPLAGDRIAAEYERKTGRRPRRWVTRAAAGATVD